MHSTQRVASESPALTAARARVAIALRTEAVHLAERWEQQSRTVALWEPAEEGEPGSASRSAVAILVCSLADHLADETAPDDLIALGLALGAEAFASNRSLHHVLKGFDLLTAMTLYVAETALADERDASAADGIRVSRRLQEAFSMLTLAATRGYTQGMSATMRDRFRHLRHDLRNPLGTIKSVLAMMDDETMPVDARAHPRFRAMAKRNARSLGDLISDRLSDASAGVPSLMQQEASLRTIACSVRRDLRSRAQARGVTVTVRLAPARMLVDAVALELLLHDLLLAALQEAREGDEIGIEFTDRRADRADVSLVGIPPRSVIADPGALERLAALAGQMNAELRTTELAVTLAIAVQRLDVGGRGAERAAGMGRADTGPVTGPSSGDGEPGHDVRRAREREHGESGRL
jgi:signal transduction histidine kinase